MNATDPASSLEALVRGFETLTADRVPALCALYADDAFFKDPFNEVRGVDAVERIFAQMFEQLQAPRFVVHTQLLQGEQAFLTWDFLFGLRRWPRAAHAIHGASHLRFTPDGRVAYHRDYWDTGEELYEKLPLLGALWRGLKRLAAA